MPIIHAAAVLGALSAADRFSSRQGQRVLTAEEAKQEFLAASRASTSSDTNERIQPDSPVVTAVRPARTSSIATSSSKSLKSPTSVPSSATSTDSQAPPSVRVHTKGPTLASGFPYHPALFDLRVHPIKWERFTESIVETTKLSTKERMKVWAFGAGVVAGIGTPDSVHIARNKSRRYQEDKIKAGLAEESESSLGELLRQWNERYFAERGLLARLELSESALKSPNQQSKLFQREAHWYGNKEDRERKREERKFAIVITQLYTPDELGHSMHELDASSSIQEAPDSADARFHCVEAPTANKDLPELPSGADWEKDVSELPDRKVHLLAELPSATQYAELEGDSQPILQSSNMISAATHAKLHQNMSHV
ncbi:hypothetical protein HII31_10939 [Pseudocercospora fuligena]|uniref:Uncharacterized protein n=1 Tax=Pseudocercospora fuligena TaxID=685502 RepID=A0A8H6VDT7_9PEZI|nr:hypothetical protein HII31_10939 [Pseudocercospora fuligena]